MNYTISISLSGEVTFSNDLISAYPDLHGVVDGSILKLSGTCMKSLPTELIEIQFAGQTVFFDDGVTILDTPDTSVEDVIDSCVVAFFIDNDVSITKGSMYTLSDIFSLGVQLDYSKNLERYINNEISVDDLQAEIEDIYISEKVIKDRLEAGYLSQVLSSVSIEDIESFIETNSKIPQEVLDSVNNSTKLVNGSVTYVAGGYLNELHFSDSVLTYLRSPLRVSLSSTERKSTFARMENTDIFTLVANVDYDTLLNNTTMMVVTTPFGADIHLDYELKLLSVEINNIHFSRESVAPYLLGWAIAKVLERCIIIDEIEVFGMQSSYPNVSQNLLSFSSNIGTYLGSNAFTHIQGQDTDAYRYVNGQFYDNKKGLDSASLFIGMMDTFSNSNTDVSKYAPIKTSAILDVSINVPTFLSDNLQATGYTDTPFFIELTENSTNLVEIFVEGGDYTLKDGVFEPQGLSRVHDYDFIYSDNMVSKINSVSFLYDRYFGFPEYEKELVRYGIERGTLTIHMENGDPMLIVENGVATTYSVHYLDATIGRNTSFSMLYDMGIREFNRVNDNAFYHIGMYSDTIIHEGVDIAPKHLFLWGDIQGYNNGVIPTDNGINLTEEHPLSSPLHEVYVNGVPIMNINMMVKTLLGEDDINLWSPYNIRSEDMLILLSVMLKAREIFKNNLLPIQLPLDDELVYGRVFSMAKQRYMQVLSGLHTLANGGEITIETYNEKLIQLSLSTVVVTNSLIRRDNGSICVEMKEDGTIVYIDVDSAILDGNILKTKSCYIENNGQVDVKKIRRDNIDIRTDSKTSSIGETGDDDCATFDYSTNIPTSTPIEQDDGNYVHYTFTENADGSVTVNYTAFDKDGNDITDEFKTLSIGDYFLHKDVL